MSCDYIYFKYDFPLESAQMSHLGSLQNKHKTFVQQQYLRADKHFEQEQNKLAREQGLVQRGGGQGSQAKNYNIGCWNEEIMLSKWKAVFLDKDRIETPYQRGIPSGYPRRLTTQWSPNNVLPMQQKQTGMQKMSSMLSGSIPPLLLTVFNLGRCAYTVDSDW